jgi:hypothetical protein
MAYGSRVRRQGRGRPHSPYHARSRSRTEPSVEGTTAARSPAQLTRPARAAILPRGDCHRDVVGALPGRVRTVHVCVRQASDEVRPRRGDAPRRLGRGAIRRRSGSSLRRVSRPLAPTGTDRRSIRTAVAGATSTGIKEELAAALGRAAAPRRFCRGSPTTLSLNSIRRCCLRSCGTTHTSATSRSYGCFARSRARRRATRGSTTSTTRSSTTNAAGCRS